MGSQVVPHTFHDMDIFPSSSQGMSFLLYLIQMCCGNYFDRILKFSYRINNVFKKIQKITQSLFLF